MANPLIPLDIRESMNVLNLSVSADGGARAIHELESFGLSVFPCAQEAILKYAGLRILRSGKVRSPILRLDPELMCGETLWIREISLALGKPICPLGEYRDVAMLFITEDGVIWHNFEGQSIRLADNIDSAVRDAIEASKSYVV